MCLIHVYTCDYVYVEGRKVWIFFGGGVAQDLWGSCTGKTRYRQDEHLLTHFLSKVLICDSCTSQFVTCRDLQFT